MQALPVPLLKNGHQHVPFSLQHEVRPGGGEWLGESAHDQAGERGGGKDRRGVHGTNLADRDVFSEYQISLDSVEIALIKDNR